MRSGLHDFLSRDHERLGALLSSCRAADGPIPEAVYSEFRKGLLRHIGIEERVLFPELRKQRGVTELELRLHRDHAALAALLVPPPSRTELDHIAAILDAHNELEESDGGLYDVIEAIAADELPSLMQRVHAIPEIPLAPYADTEITRGTIEKLLRDIGRIA
jgi:hypothetical protein